MDIEELPVRLLSFGHHELQHSFAALGDCEVGTGASKIGLQPLSELARCVLGASSISECNVSARGGWIVTHAGANGHEGETLILVLMRPLHSEHVQSRFGDFV